MQVPFFTTQVRIFFVLATTLSSPLLFKASATAISYPGCDDLKPSDFRKVEVVNKTNHPSMSEPLQMDIAPDGKVFFVERVSGLVKVWNPSENSVQSLIKLNVLNEFEIGLSGIVLDPDFANNRRLYVYYPVAPKAKGLNRISRLTLNTAGDKLENELPILDFARPAEYVFHGGGSMAFDAQGNLYLGTGDNTRATDRYGAINATSGDRDARRTAGNTNDLNGKILRIKPISVPEGETPTPGPGSTYLIPEGNLFAGSSEKTRPEIYTMGNRHPFTLYVDPVTGWLVWGEIGPDAFTADPNKGPAGHDEFNLAKTPGNYGWPFFVADNKAYNDFDYLQQKSGPKFNAQSPVNNSPFNTGLTNLPSARPSLIGYGKDESFTRWPGFAGGTASCAISGPIYRYDGTNSSKIKMPPHLNGKWFIAEFSKRWLKVATLSENGDSVIDVDSPFSGIAFGLILDLEMGPDGALYVLEYSGGQWFGTDAGTKISRIDYVGNCLPKIPVSIQSYPAQGQIHSPRTHRAYSLFPQPFSVQNHLINGKKREQPQLIQSIVQ